MTETGIVDTTAARGEIGRTAQQLRSCAALLDAAGLDRVATRWRGSRDSVATTDPGVGRRRISRR